MQSTENLEKNLAPQSYWDDAYKDYVLQDNDDEDEIVAWIKKYVPINANGSCIEIGCFPGRYLTVFGKLKYTLHGVDLTPRVLKDFPEWLKSLNYNTGKFEQNDFFNFNAPQKYDVVCSFGFIEHFKNWETVLEKHIAMVQEGGYLVIETPNFKGFFQRLIHLVLDYENYKRHYIESMSPKKWKKICEKHGLTVVFSGYLGTFKFWIDQPPKTYIQKKILDKLIKYYPRLMKLKEGKASYSPYCGIIAKLEKRK